MPGSFFDKTHAWFFVSVDPWNTTSYMEIYLLHHPAWLRSLPAGLRLLLLKASEIPAKCLHTMHAHSPDQWELRTPLQESWVCYIVIVVHFFAACRRWKNQTGRTASKGKPVRVECIRIISIVSLTKLDEYLGIIWRIKSNNLSRCWEGTGMHHATCIKGFNVNVDVTCSLSLKNKMHDTGAARDWLSTTS